jgi:heme exporter protein C
MTIVSRSKRPPVFEVLILVTGLTLGALLYWTFFRAPIAQEAAGGFAQKIFYFHVPAAYAMYLSGVVCFLGSAAYLARETDTRDALARAGAECAVAFGALMLVSGPLWAKKAWGVYWTWDPRLTTTLLSVLIYVAIVVLRQVSGEGQAERRFAAALGVLGTVNLPVIHYSVKKWGGNHPTVITGQGGGLGHPDMKLALGIGFLTLTLLALLLIWSRTRLALAEARLSRIEEAAYTDALQEDD